MNKFQCLACGGVYYDQSPEGIPYAHACAPLPADKKNPERERPDKRDENIVIATGGKLMGIKSEGAGVTCLTSDTINEPKWISAVNKAVAAREEKENA